MKFVTAILHNETSIEKYFGYNIVATEKKGRR